MIKSILKVGLLLLIGIIGYNYFFGTPEEKEQSKEIIGKVGEIGKAGVGLLKAEVQKFKSGKYDDALDKIANLLSSAKQKVEEEGGAVLEEIEDWQERKEKWQEKKEQLKELLAEEKEGQESEAIKNQIKELNEEGEALEKEGKKLLEKD